MKASATPSARIGNPAHEIFRTLRITHYALRITRRGNACPKPSVPYSPDFVASWPVEIYHISLADASMQAHARARAMAEERARGAIELRPGLTTGAIARTLRSPAFGAVAETFEEVAYGGRAATKAEAAAAKSGWKTVLAERRRDPAPELERAA